MNRVLAVAAALALPFVVFAEQDGCVGTYRLKLTDESRSVLRLLGRHEPSGILRLNSDRKCVLEMTGDEGPSRRLGSYELTGQSVSIRFSDSDEHHADWHGRDLTLDGLTFVREADFTLVGTWTVRTNGLEDKSIKLMFGKDGSFRFACWGATSEGKYEVADGKLTLLYTRVDDQAVELGSMKKEISLNLDGLSFNIDRYRYERATS